MKNKQIYIGGAILTLVLFYFFVNKSKAKKNTKAIIIGDSQTPFIAKQTTKANLLGSKSGEDVLWKGGQNLDWLLKAVSKYPITNDIGYVVISIGTNGGFKQSDKISELVSELKRVFPNAELLAVKGSWNWGFNTADRGVNEEKVNKYYDRFAKLGVKVMPTPIGAVEPHSDRPSYKQIGKEIDNYIG